MADHHLDNVAEASAAKAHGARTAQYVTNRAMVLLGEEALEPGHLVEKCYRDAKIVAVDSKISGRRRKKARGS
jgi:alkylation response protein AidB-like acyl-CoA dehydrogenase